MIGQGPPGSSGHDYLAGGLRPRDLPMGEDIESYNLNVGAHRSRFTPLQRVETKRDMKITMRILITGCW